MEKKTFNNGEVYVLNNAIDTKAYKYNSEIRNETRKSLHLNNKFVIGHIGRFSDPKNHSFLIKVFAEVSKIKENSTLLLVGEGPLLGRVQKLVIKYSLEDKILFLGLRTDISDLLQAMDVFVLPSLYEGLPVIAVEAQAAGLPCVVSDNVTNEIELTNILTFESLNTTPSVWAKKVISFATNIERRDVSREVIDAGYEIENEAKKLEELYINICKDLERK